MSGPAQLWARASAVLDELLERPADEWPEAVARHCGEDAPLRREVMRLLAAHRQAEGFLAEPALALMPTLLDDMGSPADDDEPPAPETVGPWRIVRELGRGGMGVVYLAQRTGEQFQQQAALKLVRTGIGSAEVLARFRRERQILASLDHPNIARLLDGGRAEDGRPYLAMEFVEGEPLTAYCRARALGIEERLRLFLAICQAVQHAHSRLVVHRDLKPSNILVTEAGAPRLLDFGIAKLLAEDEDEPSLTRTGRAVMTPDYAAPEQLSGESVSTATDVYGLGVVLYELLAGQHPFRGPRRTADGGPTRRPELTRPSLAVQDRALRRRLSGDLDTIVLMAMRPEPARRYASAEALGKDIERHLAGLTVSARPDTLGYRARTFARRHRWGVAASAAAVLVLLAFAATMAAQARRTARQRDRAERVSRFLVDLFRVANPMDGAGQTLTAREVLDRGADRIEHELAAEPEVQGDLMATMGQAYAGLGLMEPAERLFGRAVELRRRSAGPNDPRALVLMGALGNAHVRRGRFDEGLRIFAEVAERWRQVRGDEDPQTLRALNDLGFWQGYVGRYAEAERVARQVLDTRRRVLGPEHRDTIWSMNDVAVALGHEGRYAEAAALSEEVLALWSRVKESRTADVVDAGLFKNNLAVAYQGQRRYDAAEKALVDARDTLSAALGPEHLNTLLARKDLAILRCVTARYDDCAAGLRGVIDGGRRVLGPRHADTLQAQHWLSVAYREQGRIAEAERIQAEVLAVQRETLGAEHPDVLVSLGNLGRIRAREGRRQEGQSLLAQAVEVQRRRFGPGHPMTAESLYGLSCVAALDGRRGDAIALLRQAVQTGHVDPDRVLREADLAALRTDPELRRLVAAARANGGRLTSS